MHGGNYCGTKEAPAAAKKSAATAVRRQRGETCSSD